MTARAQPSFGTSHTVILALRQYPQGEANTACHSEQSEESKISDPYHPTLWIPAYAGMTVRQVCGAYRHCGLDPQSRGQCHGAAVILALRQYPQGGAYNKTTQPYPLSLDVRETKACPSA